jgi:hypothetical protein
VYWFSKTLLVGPQNIWVVLAVGSQVSQPRRDLGHPDLGHPDLRYPPFRSDHIRVCGGSCSHIRDLGGAISNVRLSQTVFVIFLLSIHDRGPGGPRFGRKDNWRKYNSGDEHLVWILGCPRFARFWQTWDPARSHGAPSVESCCRQDPRSRNRGETLRLRSGQALGHPAPRTQRRTGSGRGHFECSRVTDRSL